MSLNCKPGDMALIVSGSSRYVGETVTCELFVGEHSVISDTNSRIRFRHEDLWLIDRELGWVVHGFNGDTRVAHFRYIPDKFLMPLNKGGDAKELANKLIKERLKQVQK